MALTELRNAAVYVDRRGNRADQGILPSEQFHYLEGKKLKNETDEERERLVYAGVSGLDTLVRSGGFALSLLNEGDPNRRYLQGEGEYRIIANYSKLDEEAGVDRVVIFGNPKIKGVDILFSLYGSEPKRLRVGKEDIYAQSREWGEWNDLDIEKTYELVDSILDNSGEEVLRENEAADVAYSIKLAMKSGGDVN